MKIAFVMFFAVVNVASALELTASPDFQRELEFECGKNVECRSALTEKRANEETAAIDLEALETLIVAEGTKLQDEKSVKQAFGPVELEKRAPQMVKRPRRKF